MKINYKGKEVEAYNLIMKRENALEILSGKKKLEIRQFSDRYVSMFIDNEQLEKNEILRKEGRDEECIEPLKGIEFIHFHNYNNSWFLDVKIDEIGMSSMSEEDINILSEELDFHDFDNEWQQYRELSDDEKPMFFWLKISEIVSHNL